MKTKETVREFIQRSRENHSSVKVYGQSKVNSAGFVDVTVTIGKSIRYEIVGDNNGQIVTLDAVVSGKKINLRDNR